MTVREQLIKVWENEVKNLASLDVKEDGEAYERQLKRVNELERNIVELEKSMNDTAAKTLVSKRESTDSKWNLAGDIIKASIPVVGAFTMGLISMKWEKLETITSTAGKTSLRDAMKFR